MSDKDLVKEAALKALSGARDAKASANANTAETTQTATEPEKASAKSVTESKTQAPKTTKLPEKGSAESEAHKQAAAEANIRPSEPEKAMPQKGGAEAAIHNMVAREQAGMGSGATPQNPEQGLFSSNLGFLSLVILLPLLIVGGLYFYVYSMQDNIAALDARRITALEREKARKQGSETAQKNTKSEPAPGAAATPETKVAASPALITPAAPETPKAGPPATTPVPKITATPKTSETSTPAKAALTAPAANPAPAEVEKTATATPEVPAKTTDNTPHWDYKSTDWAAIDPAFKTCGEGQTQSPINITTNNLQTGPGFQYNYRASAGKVLNNGHSMQVDLAKGNTLLVAGKSYDLIQFHFHTPGENAINGKQAPMEVHLVHKNAQNHLAVVAVMIAAGGSNQLIDKMPVPANKGDHSTSAGPHINPMLLLPQNRSSFTFSGSLTTPPCTQNVGWIVMQQPVLVSSATIAKFSKVLGKNNRPLQPANGRAIYQSN